MSVDDRSDRAFRYLRERSLDSSCLRGVGRSVEDNDSVNALKEDYIACSITNRDKYPVTDPDDIPLKLDVVFAKLNAAWPYEHPVSRAPHVNWGRDMFWKVITFISALAAVSSAAVAQSDVTVEQTGSVDPDKSMFGFKLPSKKLTITSSPPGAEVTLS